MNRQKQIKILEKYLIDGVSANKIAKEMKMSKNTVLKFLNEKGITIRQPKNKIRDEYGRFIRKGQVLPPMEKENVYNWNGGISIYRKIAFENLPNECFYCSKKENLDVHHINKNRYDNKISNLRIVCRKCHLHNEHPEIIKRLQKRVD